MLGDISDKETNDLISMMSKSVSSNMLKRNIVESQIFPVTHYIGVACYILYDQSYQYNILKKITSIISPEDIAKRSKSLGSPLNQLAFYSLAMLYLHGRAQVINDNIYKKNKGEPNIIVEPEEKKRETKFVLDFWRRLSPNYLNEGTLTVEDKNLTILPSVDINNLRDQMIPIDNNIEFLKKVKETIAHLTIFNFLYQAECRAGIFEHGPYYLENNSDPLIFKEFQFLYTGKEMFGIDLSGYFPHKITKPSSISNIIFGMTLKNMKKIEFNDWGTLFALPSDFTSNITSIGLWTKEEMHPKNLRYPEKLGNLIPLSAEILDDLMRFAKAATRELYMDFSKWSFLKKLMLGTNLYANSPALYCAYAGIENDFNWTWALDYAAGKTLETDLINPNRIEFYINQLKKWKGAHYFLSRILSSSKIRDKNPLYYLLQD